MNYVCCVFVDYSASVGSEEESGKDWDELEEEARKGSYVLHTTCFSLLILQLHHTFREMLNIFIAVYKKRSVVKCVIVINNESVIYGKADVGGVHT